MTAFANFICHSLTNDQAFSWRLAEAGIGARIALCKWSNLKKMLDSRMVSLAADLYHRSLRYFSQAEESPANLTVVVANGRLYPSQDHSSLQRLKVYYFDYYCTLIHHITQAVLEPHVTTHINVYIYHDTSYRCIW
jgi:hypothetical protein